MNLEKEIFDISLTDIIPNRFQPREIFKEAELKELSESIKQHGVIQPIIVRKVGDKYEIIAGERRFRASQLAGKETIPALVRNIDDKETAKIALLENLQRSDLTPIEEAKTYQTILKIENLTQDELAVTLGKSQSAIANKLRLLALNEDIQTALLNSQISERHARSLIGLTNEQQTMLLHKIINEKLTVRQLDEEIIKLTGELSPNSLNLNIEDNKDNAIASDNLENTNNMYFEQPSISNQSELLNTTIPGSTTNENQNNIQNESFNYDSIISQQPELKQNEEINNNIKQPLNTENNFQVLENKESNQALENAIPQVEVSSPTPTVNTNYVEPSINNSNINNNIVEIPQVETPNNNLEPAQEVTTVPSIEPELPKKENIFDKLRVNRETNNEDTKFDLKTPDLSKIINQYEDSQNVVKETSETPDYNNIYDLRFAINNFKQAIQNTEKFGFNVKTEEQDLDNKYRIVIEIDKK